ncbi:hypothetical protein [Streptomyces sp. N2A]|uniref:hypothetical protein n=1 Tax=Streptomyces sp. N2A TaxID=3073936 RepID=UPI0028707B5B|nr:hypothetical protein [Streptomyces sp. N2A]
MITAAQGAKIAALCASCGGVLVRDIGQFIDRGQLRWSVEGQCRACPNAWCEMGAGPAPEELRQALLAEHGAARLHLPAKETSLVHVLRALRETRHLTLGEARLTAVELRKVGLVGTSVEMAHLAEALRKRSIATTVVPLPT